MRRERGLDTTALSIIVVNWNTRALLARCLTSVYASVGTTGESESAHLSFEVLVVDNASTDGSSEMVRQEFPWVELVENIENVGFARANNQGFRLSTQRYVLMLNPDTEVQQGALAALVSFMDGHPQAGGAGARLLSPNGAPQISAFPKPALFRELWRLFHLDAISPYACYPEATWHSDEPREVDVAQGACLILRRVALEQVGPLDEDYFVYSEEIDLCHRLRRRGWKIYWVPQATVVHHGGQSTRQVAASMFLRLYQGKILYFRKHGGWGVAQTYKLILLIAALARLLLSPLALLEPTDQRRGHLALADRYWQLVKALPRL